MKTWMIVLAFCAGFAARDVLVQTARADGTAQVYDTAAVVRALQAQAEATKDVAAATKDVAREVREAGGKCR